LAMCLWGILGLKTKAEMFACAIWFGLVSSLEDCLSRDAHVCTVVWSIRLYRSFSPYRFHTKGSSPQCVLLLTNLFLTPIPWRIRVLGPRSTLLQPLQHHRQVRIFSRPCGDSVRDGSDRRHAQWMVGYYGVDCFCWGGFLVGC
jgi:hypothetical protein